MPTYVYEVITQAGDGERFEVVQQMSEDALTSHPETGEPVRRIFLPPNIASRYTERTAVANSSDDGKLERLGFTKYVKSGDGKYEKTIGKGPSQIQR